MEELNKVMEKRVEEMNRELNQREEEIGELREQLVGYEGVNESKEEH